MANLSNKKAQTHHSQNWPCTATIHNGEVCAVDAHTPYG